MDRVWWKAMLHKVFSLAVLFSASLAAAEVPEFLVAGLKVVPDQWDKEANFKKLDRFARQAAGKGAKVVITPESFLDGYVGNDAGVNKEKYFEVAESLDGPMIRRVRELARELKIYLSIGFPELRGKKVYNSVIMIGPDGSVVSQYSKTHCGSEPYNTEGTAFPVIATPLGRWGTLICLDRQLPETSRILAIKGAQVILVPSYGMHGEMNDVMMRTRAYENGVYVIFVHPKRCLMIDPKGKVIAADNGEGDQIVLGNIRIDDRVGSGPIRARRPKIYGELLRK